LFAIYCFTNLAFIFGDMIQFAFPYLIAFFVGGLLCYKKPRALLLAIILTGLVFNLFGIIELNRNYPQSISNEDFSQLLALRENFHPDEKTLLVMDADIYGTWLTLVSKDSKILYPLSYKGEDLGLFYSKYFIATNETLKGLTIFELQKRNNRLEILKVDSLSAESFGFGRH
jgi:hypothetical protein